MKLNSDDIKIIKKLLKRGVKQVDIANKFGISQVAVSHIKTGERVGARPLELQELFKRVELLERKVYGITDQNIFIDKADHA